MKHIKGEPRRATRERRRLARMVARIRDYDELVSYLGTVPKAQRRATFELIEPHLTFRTHIPPETDE